MNRKFSSFFIAAGAPLVFWGTLFITASMRESYSHFADFVSSLGTMGTNTQYYFTAGLVLTGIVTSVMIYRFNRICRNKKLNSLPVLLIATHAFSVIGAGIFPLPLRLHGQIGTVSVLILFAPALCIWLWGNRDIRGLKSVNILVTVLFLHGCLIFFPDIMEGYTGLKQRFFHAGWTIWFLWLGWVFSTDLKTEA